MHAPAKGRWRPPHRGRGGAPDYCFFPGSICSLVIPPYPPFPPGRLPPGSSLGYHPSQSQTLGRGMTVVLAKPFGGVASPRISPSPGPPSVPRQTVTQVAVWWEGADGGPWPLGAGAGGGPWRYLAAALLFPPLRCRATLTWWRGLASPRAFAVCWRARGGDQEPGDISIVLLGSPKKTVLYFIKQ